MVLLQIGRVITAALAVFWIISLLGWLPEVIASGQFGWRPLLGIAVAVSPALVYTWLTKLVNAKKAKAANGEPQRDH